MAKKAKAKPHKKRDIVMEEFHKGKLRSSSGQKVTNPMQAVAIAYSEEREAKKRGAKMRTWRGRRRMRPNRAKKRGK